MPGRRFHGKTKTGCLLCKARHVKCGEERPTCNNCRRRSTACVYPGDISSPSSVPARISRSPIDPPMSDAFDALDLTLMHRYATHTALNMIPLEAAIHVWHIEIPIMARDSSVLQHGILALASMDLASVAARNQDLSQVAIYRARSIQHQSKALPCYRDLLEHGKTPADQNVIFIFSIMLLLLAFASVHSADARPSLDEILNVFALFRGPRLLWHAQEDSANGQLIEALFPNFHSSMAAIEKQSVPEEYTSLSRLPLDEPSAEALEKLIESAKFVYARPQDIRGMGWFPSLAPDTFYAQVREHKPYALAILAQFTSILGFFETRWWVGPWNSILSSAIQDVLLQESITLPRIPDIAI